MATVAVDHVEAVVGARTDYRVSDVLAVRSPGDVDYRVLPVLDAYEDLRIAASFYREDLDSDPTKIIEVVEIGKQLLITRGALTTFSIANDVAKYFAILPAIFTIAIPNMKLLNVMGLSSPNSAIISALIFNAIIIPLLIPIAMRGVKFKPMSADLMLLKNLTIYGLGGIIAPFIGIKLIDFLITPLLHMMALA